MTRAAQFSYSTQPAVSLTLSEMEDYYQCRLFDRIRRKLHINEAGTRLYGYARRVLNLLDDMDSGMLQSNVRSLLRIGSCESMGACGLINYVSGFSEADADTTFRTSFDTTESLINRVISNELDLAIIDRMPGSSLLEADRLFASRIALAAAPSTGYADGEAVTAKELEGESFLLREKGSGIRMVFEQDMEKYQKPA